jgi:alcohol dehydrogenase (cytochrome c)
MVAISKRVHKECRASDIVSGRNNAMTLSARALLVIFASTSVDAQVSFDRISHADQEPQNWLTYSGSNFSQRYSQLNQITLDNVAGLQMQWAFQARSLEVFEATPLVVDGMMYLTQPPNDVVALDAATGQIKWLRSYRPAADTKVCCGRVNRGLAILGNTLYMGTVDAHLMALDARTGEVLWNKEVAKSAAGYSITHAPLVVRNKIVVGTAGGEYGIRGFIAAFDAATGNEEWRFYTIPGKGEPGNESWPGDTWMHGGGSVWVTGSYDPETNLTYWGTGNPSDDYNGDHRVGDNLYTDSVVALDGDTGKLKWHFQFTPHDVWDFDATQVPVLADLNWTGRDGRTQPRKVMLWANRNGYFYALDRANGQFLQGKEFTKVTWATGLDERGRPMRITAAEPTVEGAKQEKNGTNWFSPSYSPRTGFFYIPVWEDVGITYTKKDDTFEEGKFFAGGGRRMTVPIRRGQTRQVDQQGYGVIRAIDPHTGEKRWDFKMNEVTTSGILTTASDLLFTGSREGLFQALNARTGQLLWKVAAGGEIAMGPMTYAVSGKQYVAFAAGSSLFVYGLK